MFHRQLNVARTVKLLQLYSASSEDLIYNYYAERFRHQLEQQHPNGSETNVYPIGSINIRAIGKSWITGSGWKTCSKNFKTPFFSKYLTIPSMG